MNNDVDQAWKRRFEALFDVMGYLMRSLQSDFTRQMDIQIEEVMADFSAAADVVAVKHTFYRRDNPRNLFGIQHAMVHQRAQVEQGKANRKIDEVQGDHNGCPGVHVGNLKTRADNRSENGDGNQKVALVVERIGSEEGTRQCVCALSLDAGHGEVEGHGDAQDDEAPDGKRGKARGALQPLERHRSDLIGRDEEQERKHDGGHCLELSVAVRVAFVGRFARQDDGNNSNQCRGGVKKGMDAVRDKGQTLGGTPVTDFQGTDGEACRERNGECPDNSFGAGVHSLAFYSWKGQPH